MRHWCDYARRVDDPFVRFFSYWIALVVTARADLREADFTGGDTDRKALLRYCEARRLPVARAMQTRWEDLEWLAHRRSTGSNDPVLDVYGHTTRAVALRMKFAQFAAFSAQDHQRNPAFVAEAVVEILNHIRNNLFHGRKDPDDALDRDLVTRANRLLEALLDSAT